jgi:hypothetical protein
MNTSERREVDEAPGRSIKRRGDVLCPTIQRECRRNAINQAVLDGILKGQNHSRSDRSVRAVVRSRSRWNAVSDLGNENQRRGKKIAIHRYPEARASL